MKNFILILTVLSLVFTICSCGTFSTVFPNNENEVSDEKISSEKTSSEETSSEKIFTHHTEAVADFTADSIEFFKTDAKYNYFVVKEGKTCRLIDSEGMWQDVAGLELTSAYPAQPIPDGEVRLLLSDKNYYEYWLNADNTLEEVGGRGWGGLGSCEVYWYQNAPLMLNSQEGEIECSHKSYLPSFWTREVMGTICTGPYSKVVPIQQISSYEYVGGYGETFDVVKSSEKYALFSFETNSLLTDFIFDDVNLVGFQEGVLAVKKDGKWGYVSSSGEMLTEFEYEPSKADSFGNEYMYSALNGYIILKKDGKWGMMNTNGDIVLNTVFDGISNVSYDGKFWYKQNGEWKLNYFN